MIIMDDGEGFNPHKHFSRKRLRALSTQREPKHFLMPKPSFNHPLFLHLKPIPTTQQSDPLTLTACSRFTQNLTWRIPYSNDPSISSLVSPETNTVAFPFLPQHVKQLPQSSKDCWKTQRTDKGVRGLKVSRHISHTPYLC